ncbi:unnamed protein product [Cyclocybe aegerita]|uniref:Paired amphipathic helix protein Sin3a n=1 Tax=Cyclocybe aegerita TaxID=1973307 RepID=A0A8S0WG38_CYCAE|nr:unnamed protein product [Cyclocybe aegerita]
MHNNPQAVDFLDNMKSQFQEDGAGRYESFLGIMKDFRSNAIDTREVLVRVCSVLNGYPELVRGFNSFLPEGYQLEPSDPNRERDRIPSITINTPKETTVYPRDYRHNMTGSIPPRLLKSQYY